MRKPDVFPQADSGLSEREMEETIPFSTATERTQYFGTNLMTDVKELRPENYSTLIREMKEDTNKRT